MTGLSVAVFKISIEVTALKCSGSSQKPDLRGSDHWASVRDFVHLKPDAPSLRIMEATCDSYRENVLL